MSDFGFWFFLSVIVVASFGAGYWDNYLEKELKAMCFEAGGFYQSDGSCVQRIPLE